MAEAIELTGDGYEDYLRDLKFRIRQVQIRTLLTVNRELIALYWRIGKDLVAREESQAWGSQIIERLAADLRREFPELKGLAARNLWYMKALARAWPDEAILQRGVAELPWRHHCRLLDCVKDPAQREWYLRAAIEHGWSADAMVHHIDTRLHERQGRPISNFERTLPPEQSDLAQQLLKDPYTFDFLSLGPGVRERDLQRGLIEHLRDFLIELGVGFAFVGCRQHLEVDGQDFYLDLLFYHLRLRCFVVVELKVGAFEPEYAGKMGFYLSAVDDHMRHPEDRATIGILLCKTKSRVIAEYALRDVHKPMGIATWQAKQALPLEWRESLPSIQDLEAELAKRSSGRTRGRGLEGA